MIVLASVFYLVACMDIATILASSIALHPLYEEMVPRFLAWVVFFFATFLGGFYVLGDINLATNLPVVDPRYGSVIVLVALVLLGLVFRGRVVSLLSLGGSISRGRPAGWQGSSLRNALGRGLPAVTLITFSLIALMLIVGFPRGFEPQAYHLPIGLYISQAKSLKIWDTAYMHTFPANTSLYFGFLLGFMSEHLVAAAGLVFLLPLVGAVYELGRATGADRTASLLMALGLVTIPMIAFSSFEAGPDVAGAAFLAMAAYFAIVNAEKCPCHQMLSGLAAGLAFGFKSLHVVSIAFLLGLILWRVWRKSRGDGFSRRVWGMGGTTVIFLGAVLAMSGFWLVRNYVQLGNPVYPVHLPVVFDALGWTKAPDIDYVERGALQFEWVRSSSEWLVYPWVEWHYIGENFKHSSGLGPFFAATVPVSCLMGLGGVIAWKGREWPMLAALLSGGLCVLLVWWVVGDHQPRYFMGALVFLVPLVAWTVSLTSGRSRQALEYLVMLCILIGLSIIFSKQLMEAGASFIYARQFTRQTFYGYPAMIDRLPPGSTVVNLGERIWNYALFGRIHRNRVVSYSEASRLFEQSPADGEQASEPGRVTFYLASSPLAQMGATHVFTVGSPNVRHDDCILLHEIDRLDRDPVVQTILPKPQVLYEIQNCQTHKH
jgi:hypothetical protein